jgi:nitroreductase
VEVAQALRQRRMTRAFDGTELSAAHVATLCSDAVRAPTAGNARGVDLVVLAGRRGVAQYLGAATDPAWTDRSGRAGGFAAAGAAVAVVCDPTTYAERYADTDKSESGLSDLGAWPVPYWYGDAAFATMALLLLAESDGLASCFLGAFRRHEDVLALVGAPSTARLFGAVLLGNAAVSQTPSTSLARPGPTRSARVHLGTF